VSIGDPQMDERIHYAAKVSGNGAACIIGVDTSSSHPHIRLLFYTQDDNWIQTEPYQ
jgi:hypothetical protein